MLERLRAHVDRIAEAGSFRRAVVTLLSGSGLAIAISYLAQPFLTRLYPPEAFGVLDVFVSMATLLMPLASLRYEPALMLPEDDRDAAGLLWLIVLLSTLATALLSVLIFWREPIASFLRAPRLSNWLPLVPPALFILLMGKTGRYWLMRQERFQILSVGRVAKATSTQGLRLGAGLMLTASAGYLIGGYILGLGVAAALYLAFIFRGSSRKKLWSGFGWSRLRRLARRYRRFPFFTMPSVLFNTLARRLPFLLLLYFFDEAVVGQYGRATLLLAAPLGLVGESVGQVFFARGAKAHRRDVLPSLTQRVHARLVAFMLFPTLALMLTGPDVLSVVLGENWRPAGHYVRYLGLWIMLGAIAAPLTVLFDVLERQRLDLLMSLLLFTLQTAALVAGGLLGSLAGALLLLGAAGLGGRLVHLVVILRIGNVPVEQAARAYLRPTLWSMLCLFPLPLVMLLDQPIVTTLSAVLSGIGYMLIIALIEHPADED